MSFMISDAIAAVSAAPKSQADGGFSLIMIAAIFVLFYFMLIRPQNKRAKEHKALITNLKKGDEVVISGGVLGKVVSIEETIMTISIAQGVEIHVQRNAVSSVLPKGTLKSI